MRHCSPYVQRKRTRPQEKCTERLGFIQGQADLSIPSLPRLFEHRRNVSVTKSPKHQDVRTSNHYLTFTVAKSDMQDKQYMQSESTSHSRKTLTESTCAEIRPRRPSFLTEVFLSVALPPPSRPAAVLAALLSCPFSRLHLPQNGRQRIAARRKLTFLQLDCA